MNEKELKFRLQRDAAKLGEFSEELLERIMSEVRQQPGGEPTIEYEHGNEAVRKWGQWIITRAALMAGSIVLGIAIWSFLNSSPGLPHETRLVRFSSNLPPISEVPNEGYFSRGIEEISPVIPSRPAGVAQRLVQALPGNIGVVHELIPEEPFRDLTISEKDPTLYSELPAEEEESILLTETFTTMWEDVTSIVGGSFIWLFEE